MTRELYERWINSYPPFDGLTLSLASEDQTSLSTLREALRLIIEQLQQARAEYGPLYTAADWHEHDGYISEARLATWEETLSWLKSDYALYAARQVDSYVRTAIMPSNVEFYLRFYIPDDSDNEYPEQRGNFDLTSEPEAARMMVTTVEMATGLFLRCEPAKQFFDRSYGG